MSEVPAWKQDIEHVAQIIHSQKMGIYAECADPLPIPEGSLGHRFRSAYGFVLLSLGEPLLTEGRPALSQEHLIRRGMLGRYTLPQSVIVTIMDRAHRDMTEIDRL